MRKALVNRLDGDPVEIEGNGGMRVSPAGRGRDPKGTDIIRVASASSESPQLCRYRADFSKLTSGGVAGEPPMDGGTRYAHRQPLADPPGCKTFAPAWATAALMAAGVVTDRAGTTLGGAMPAFGENCYRRGHAVTLTDPKPKSRPLQLYVRLADDEAVFVILFAKKCAEICAARSDRMEPLEGKLCPDFRCLHCGGEPIGQQRDAACRGLGWGNHPEPDFDL
jgi:hypothetical protein